MMQRAAAELVKIHPVQMFLTKADIVMPQLCGRASGPARQGSGAVLPLKAQ